MFRYILAAVLGLGLFGCVEQSAVADPVVVVQEEVVVPSAPPAPLTEVIVVRPGPNYYWIRGYHVWTGAVWSWTPGRWVVHPGRGYYWVHPRYYWRGGRHVWIRGYWRR